MFNPIILKLIKTTFFSGVITLIRISAGFVSTKIIAIFTGPSGVALVGAFNNFITIALTFANGAINTGIVKYTAEYNEDEPKLKSLFSTSLRISLFCSVCIGSLLFVFGTFFSRLILTSDIYANATKVLGVTIVFYSLNSLLISILNGKGEIKIFTIVNTIGSISGLIFTVFLVYWLKLDGALYALVLAQSLVFFITAGFIFKRKWFEWSYFNKDFDWSLAKKLGQFGLMTVISAITVPLSQIYIRNFLVHDLGIEEAGFWQALLRISDGYLLVITTSLNTYFLPKLSSLQKKKDLQTELVNGLKIIMPGVLFGCVIIYFLRYFIIKTLYTNEFLKMESLFFWQLVGDFFKMIAWVIGYLMIAKAMTKHYIIIDIVFTLSYIVLSIICVRYLGLNGVTIAFAINYFFCAIVVVILFRKILFLKA